MTRHHGTLVDEAIEAIEKVFDDISVSIQERLESLEKIENEIQDKVLELKEELEGEGGGED
jgi:prefoldin subunit 5